jgi:hypothetical protein
MRTVDRRSSKKFSEEQHYSCTTMPVAWVAKALELKRGFDILRTEVLRDVRNLMSGNFEGCDPSLTACSLMLGGFVIENLLKGIIAKKNLVPLVNGIPKFKHHTLIQLATDAGVAISPDEEILLQRLTEFILWKGRYPAPQKPEALGGYTTENGGFESLVTMRPIQDMEATAALINRFFVEIK